MISIGVVNAHLDSIVSDKKSIHIRNLSSESDG